MKRRGETFKSRIEGETILKKRSAGWGGGPLTLLGAKRRGFCGEPNSKVSRGWTAWLQLVGKERRGLHAAKGIDGSTEPA